MKNIQIDDRLYDDTQRRATAAGFETVDEYVEQVLQEDLQADDESFDHLFTPERLAIIDRAAAEMDAGRGLTLEQLDANLAKSRAERLEKNRG